MPWKILGKCHWFLQKPLLDFFWVIFPKLIQVFSKYPAMILLSIPTWIPLTYIPWKILPKLVYINLFCDLAINSDNSFSQLVLQGLLGFFSGFLQKTHLTQKFFRNAYSCRNSCRGFSRSTARISPCILRGLFLADLIGIYPDILKKIWQSRNEFFQGSLKKFLLRFFPRISQGISRNFHHY